jgi:hypothetical protein
MTDTSTTERRAGADRREGGDRRAGGQLVAMFWVADAMLLGLIIFFGVVGGATDSTALSIAAIACAVLLAIHSVSRRRRQHEEVLAVSERRSRERRGF